MRKRAKAEALQDYTKKLYQDIWDLQQKRVQAEKDLYEAEQHQAEIRQELVHYRVALEEVNGAIRDVNEQIKTGNEHTIDWNKTWDNLPDSVKEVGNQIGISSLSSIEDLDKLQSALMKILGAEYDGSGLEGMYAQSKTDVEALQGSKSADHGGADDQQRGTTTRR